MGDLQRNYKVLVKNILKWTLTFAVIDCPSHLI